MSDPLDRLKGALSDRYAIIRELGAGGMAVVYLAQDLKHRRNVALKVLRPELAAMLGPERFLREIEIAAKLQHPHILPLYDSGEAAGFLYYVMPYVEGESLRERLAREGELPVADAVRVLRDVVDALAKAHSQGVVHRDIKPDNVMLSDRHALVTDFGVAKAVSEATGRQDLTTAGIALGTPAYMAPEQVAADPNVDHRADIYAVGALAYEVLTGQPPFTGETANLVLSAHVTKTPMPVTIRREALPSELSHLVMKCLEKDPADRWQSVEQMLQLLDALATPGGDISRTETRVASGTPALGRKARVVAVGTAMLLAMAVAVMLVVQLAPGGGSELLPNRVVVAVLENRTGEPSLDAVGAMAADWMTDGLTRTGLVEVVPTVAALSLSISRSEDQPAGEPMSMVEALAGETGAGTVISGAYYLQGDSLQFQVQITDAERLQVIGSFRSVGPSSQPTAALGPLGQRVMGALATAFDERFADASSAGREPPNYEAYAAFIEGMGRFALVDWPGSLEPLHRATELDSTFVLPLVVAGYAHWNLQQYAVADSVLRRASDYRERLSPADQSFLDVGVAAVAGHPLAALRAGERLVELAPGATWWKFTAAWAAYWANHPRRAVEHLRRIDPERESVRGWYFYWSFLTAASHLLGDHERELADALRGRELYPDYVSLLHYEVRALAALGRVQDIHQRLDEAQTLPPQRWFSVGHVMQVAAAELRAHGFAEAALDVVNRALEWYAQRPANEAATPGHKYELARALYLAGQWQESRTLIQEMAAGTSLPRWEALRLQDIPDSVNFLCYLGATAARLGEGTEAQQFSDRLAAVTQPYLYSRHTFCRARIAAVLGEQQRAVDLLRDAYAEGEIDFNIDWHRDIDFESLRDYPPFQEFMRPKG